MFFAHYFGFKDLKISKLKNWKIQRVRKIKSFKVQKLERISNPP